MELKDKIVLVTGGGSGLGEAAARALAAAGAQLVLLGRTPEELDEVAQDLRGNGCEVLTVEADISDEAEMRAGFQKIADRFGRLDAVFANAGINGTWAPLDELSYEDWNTTQRINLGGTFLTLHFAVPLMAERGGSIIITSSINGTRTFTTAGASAYSTSKAGQLAFGQMAALELAPRGIRVNVICPGAIESEIDDNTSKQNAQAAKYPAEFPRGTVPLTAGAPGKASDVGDLVVFLASERSRHITGTPIWIDGAQSLLV